MGDERGGEPMQNTVIKRIPVVRPLPKLKRVAAYARVSSGKDAMLHSLSSQVSYFSRIIQTHPSWTYVGTYADEAYTGTKTNRPEFQRMLKDCRAGKIDLIITKSISRFARNTVDLLCTVRELKELGIGVFFEEQNINSLSGEGELMLTILASFAQEESLSVSENRKWQIRRDFQAGKPMNLMFIYGYHLVDGRLEIHEEQAKVVRRIFQSYIAGRGSCRIAAELRQEGIPTLCGGEWRSGLVRDMLKNEKYTGNAFLQKTFVTDHVSKVQKTNQGELPMYYAEGSHSAIIDRETFERAQQILADNRRKSNAQKSHTARYAFSGMIVCGCCGKHYRRKTLSGKIWWQCTTYLAKGKQYCQAKQIPDDMLHALTCEVLGLPSFDEVAFKEKIQSIHVSSDNHVVFRLLDGRMIEKTWADRPRSKSRTGEKSQKPSNHIAEIAL